MWGWFLVCVCFHVLETWTLIFSSCIIGSSLSLESGLSLSLSSIYRKINCCHTVMLWLQWATFDEVAHRSFLLWIKRIAMHWNSPTTRLRIGVAVACGQSDIGLEELRSRRGQKKEKHSSRGSGNGTCSWTWTKASVVHFEEGITLHI